MTRNLEREREEHMQKYGSMLFCPERETLCFYMDGMWVTGCERRNGCILDDPEYQKQQEVIRKNREDSFRRQVEAEQKELEVAKMNAERGKREKFIEEMSREAYRSNRPRIGDELFEKARFMRNELKEQTNQ